MTLWIAKPPNMVYPALVYAKRISQTLPARFSILAIFFFPEALPDAFDRAIAVEPGIGRGSDSLS
jgi:hypothetical protein